MEKPSLRPFSRRGGQYSRNARDKALTRRRPPAYLEARGNFSMPRALGARACSPSASTIVRRTSGRDARADHRVAPSAAACRSSRSGGVRGRASPYFPSPGSSQRSSWVLRPEAKPESPRFLPASSGKVSRPSRRLLMGRPLLAVLAHHVPEETLEVEAWRGHGRARRRWVSAPCGGGSAR